MNKKNDDLDLVSKINQEDLAIEKYKLLNISPDD
jgi:hypothetical protein